MGCDAGEVAGAAATVSLRFLVERDIRLDRLRFRRHHAPVAESVYAVVSKTIVERHVGSNPTGGTTAGRRQLMLSTRQSDVEMHHVAPGAGYGTSCWPTVMSCSGVNRKSVIATSRPVVRSTLRM